MRSPATISEASSGTSDTTRPSAFLDRWALRQLQRNVSGAPIRFVLWDGFELTSLAAAPVATIIFRRRSALLRWLWDPELYFGEDYVSGAVEIRGDLLALVEAIYRSLGPVTRRGWSIAAGSNNRHSSKENVHRHYDLGNDFYRLWLDNAMVYTCAYFSSPEVGLEAAQVAKMDLVCRKLRLLPGERVVEAGCGWGALACFMARRYGVAVRAFNISSEQIHYAREQARQQGLTRAVEFVEGDYRSVEGECDVFVSVGMLEHVGLADYPTLGRVVDRVLTRNGRGLLHFIGRNQVSLLNPWIRRRIFPGAYAPTLGEASQYILEPHAFSVLDVENLRLHYAKTLEHWRERFENAAERVEAMFDAEFVRAWRLYLAGSQAAFTTGSMQLFQVVFARGSTNAIPWTRVSG